MNTRTAVIIFALLSLIGYACAIYGGYSGGYGGYSSKSFGSKKGVIIPLKTKGFGGGYNGGGFGGGFGGLLSFIFPLFLLLIILPLIIKRTTTTTENPES